MLVGHHGAQMSKLLQLVCLLAISTAAHADWFSTLVRYECNRQKDLLTVSYVGAANEEGQSLIATKGTNDWDPWTLVKLDRNGEWVKKRMKVLKSCRLSDGVYKVAIGPSPGNDNIVGRCGAHMSAWVEIRKGPKVVFAGGFDEADCFELDAEILIGVTLQAGGSSPRESKVKRSEFYK